MSVRYLAGLMAAAVAAPTAYGCVADLPGGARKVESARYTVAYRTQPDKITVGQHFAVELAVCANPGAAAPESVRVDAHMPEHRHGMNYKASVKPAPGGRYRAEGLMFHMPGRWEYIFELRAAGQTERLTQSELIE
jgi:YtkA-like protein